MMGCVVRSLGVTQVHIEVNHDEIRYTMLSRSQITF
jgi:hypothetical protein